MQKIITTWLILVFMAGILSAQVLDEDFDNSTSLPAGWVSSAWVVAGMGVDSSNALKQNVYGFPEWGFFNDMDIYTPIFEDLPAECVLTFDYRILDYGTTSAGYFGDAVFEIYISSPDMTEFLPVWSLQDHVDSSDFRTISIPLDDFASMTGRVNFYSFTETGYEDFDFYLDNVKIDTFAPPLDYDLKAMSITGSFTPQIGNTYEYTITVKNIGAETVEAGEWTVSLMQEENETPLGTENGVELIADIAETFTFSWTPEVIEDVQLYGVVSFENDENPANNSTPYLNVSVTPASLIYIGNPASSTRFYHDPFNLYYRQSLTQTIYYEEELAIGMITSIGYNFQRGGSSAGSNGYPVDPKSVKIWMAHTDKEVFENSTDAVSFGDFTLVFEGTIPVDVAGENDIVCELDTPFFYEGDNLVVMTQRVFETTYHSSANTWQSTATPSLSRTLSCYADGTELTVPDAGGDYPTYANQNLYQRIPNTFMNILSGPFATLQGVATDEATALEGVQITLVGTERSVWTDEAGEYTFPYVPVGSIEVKASKYGYFDSIEAVETTEDETSVVDFAMVPLPCVSVTGVVLASDTEEGLEGASVVLNGYADYETVTGADGVYTFSEVYANQTYSITVTAGRYHEYTGFVEVEGVDLDVEPITLIEKASPVVNVVAVQDAENAGVVNVSWDSPYDRSMTAYRSVGTAFMPSVTNSDTINGVPTRSITAYHIYRTTIENIEDEQLWGSIGTTQTTTYADENWGELGLGNYYYIVKAMYTGDVFSEPTISNIISKGATVTVNVSTWDDSPSIGATARLQHNTNPMFAYQATVTSGNAVNITNVSLGTYTLTVSKPGLYASYVDNAIVVSGDTTLDAMLLFGYILLSENFDDLTLDIPIGWTHIANDPTHPWHIVDFTYTYGSTGEAYPFAAHNNSAGMAGSQSYDNAALNPNNWLITPQIHIPEDSIEPVLDYYVATYQLWPDHYGVYVSTMGTATSDFTLLLQETPPGGNSENQVWTYKSIDLSAYAGTDIYIAFRHFNSSDNFWIMLDDVRVLDYHYLSTDDEGLLPIGTSLKGNYPNPFNPSTTISFDISKAGHVSIDVYNIKGQRVRVLADGEYGVGKHNVIWNGDDSAGRSVGSGVYFYRMTTQGYTSVRKMLLMK